MVPYGTNSFIVAPAPVNQIQQGQVQQVQVVQTSGGIPLSNMQRNQNNNSNQMSVSSLQNKDGQQKVNNQQVMPVQVAQQQPFYVQAPLSTYQGIQQTPYQPIHQSVPEANTNKKERSLFNFLFGQESSNQQNRNTSSTQMSANYVPQAPQLPQGFPGTVVSSNGQYYIVQTPQQMVNTYPAPSTNNQSQYVQQDRRDQK